jgi:thiol-disulfide isomerase/thioredoxin
MKDEGTVAAISILMVLAVSLLILPGAAISPGTGVNSNHAELATLASCLKSRGVVFYGAFWCPYCQKQKALFEDAASLLPYVECSNPDGRGQTPVCIQLGIRKYPTWVFPDGTRVIEKLSPQALAEKSGCAAPKE